jgi:hypothetical protein
MEAEKKETTKTIVPKSEFSKEVRRPPPADLNPPIRAPNPVLVLFYGFMRRWL